MQHNPGESIESHLMKLEAQFARFHEIDEKVNENHLVALILASVRKSPDFANVFHSAMWEDEASLTIAKVKSVLIATQRSQNINQEVKAHRAKVQFNNKSYPGSSKFRKPALRTPRDPKQGWNCPDCQMDNHTQADCTRNKRKGLKITTKRGHHAAEEASSDNSEPSNVASGFASSHSVMSRLGERVNRQSPYTNIFPQPSTSDWDDYLDINFTKYDDFNDIPPQGSSAESSLLQEDHGIGATNLSNSIINQILLQNKIQLNHQSTQKKAKHELSTTGMILNSNMKSILSMNCDTVNKLNKQKLNSNLESIWLIDSGATIHMCYSKEFLTDFKPHKGNNIIISDGSKIPIEGYGTLNFTLCNETGSKDFVSLEKVAFSPKLAVNLISVQALASLGVSVNFTTKACFCWIIL